MAKGSPFATFLIIGPVCFFLGILFATFPYDYYVLWARPPQPQPAGHALDLAAPPALGATHSPAEPRPIDPYLTRLELHLRFLAAAPALIPRVLHTVVGVGLVGLLTKLYRPSEANMLFDGASLVLYMCGITVYIANIAKGVRAVAANVYAETAAVALPKQGGNITPAQAATSQIVGGEGDDLMTREDTLKVLAASNTILALVLVGVLVLQAGQWYAQKKERQEIEEMDRQKASGGGGSSGGVAGGESKKAR